MAANVEDAHLEDNGSVTTSQQSHDAFRNHEVQIDEPAPNMAEQSKSSEAGAVEDHNEGCITAKADEVALTKEQETPANTGIQPNKPCESIDAALWPAGYYYQDSSGNTQGPCSLEYLQALHARFSEAAHMTVWAGDGTGGGYCAQLFEVLHWAASQQSQQQYSAWAINSDSAPLSQLCSSNTPQSGSGQPLEQQDLNAGTQTFASATLSEQLSGRSPQGASMQQQQQGAWASRAAPACLSAPHTEHQNGATAGEASTLPAKCMYAEAVLAGLPENDEAVQLARLAEASGNSLESILLFQYASMSCQATEGSAIQDSDPYQDVRSWCSPEEWEAHIADRQKRKDHGQPPRNWKALKRRKQEVKAKQCAMSMEWLRK